MKKITLAPGESIEINGVELNAEFLKIVRNFQDQHRADKPNDPYFKVFHPADKPSRADTNNTLLLLDQKIEYLDRLLLDHEICRDGAKAFLDIYDQFYSLSADYREAQIINDYIDKVRPKVVESIELFDKDIANLKLEIEAEKENPSDVSMALRIYSRLGHL